MFYLIEISVGDTKITGKAVYEYETQNEAVAKFHSKLGSAMGSELYDSELIMVVDNNGTVIKREKYAKPLPPEPESESEVSLDI